MKLTKVQDKISFSISDSIHAKCFFKTMLPTSYDVRSKIINEIRTPNEESIQNIQMRMLNNLKNEIN